MPDLTPEERNFLIDYCMRPENTRIALEIYQCYPELRKKIISSFLKKLDMSIKRELEECECECQWQTCIPQTNPEVGGSSSLYIMTMKKRGIEIHLALYNRTDLFVGTPRENEDNWPNGALESFLRCVVRSLNKGNRLWLWWFKPRDIHMSIESVEALSTLNDCQTITYFTPELMHFAKTISKVLETRE